MEQRLNFKQIAETLQQHSNKAQATFFYQIIQSITSPMILRTIVKYCHQRLDRLNGMLPDEHPYKKFTRAGVQVKPPDFVKEEEKW